MSYWKGLLVAVALDVVLIAGAETVEPAPVVVAPPDATPLEVADRLVDSLMVHLQGNPLDAHAMEALADLYLRSGWPEDAIGPLAHALEFAPERRALWVALERAVKASGRATITDAELLEAARRFLEAVEMWGHGC